MTTLGRLAAGFLAACAHIALWPARVAAARAVFAQLAAMDGRELADIGLTAQDLRDATALRLHEDPSSQLAGRAEEARRRAGERRPQVRPTRKPLASRGWARTGS